jgi:hypothetical protein
MANAIALQIKCWTVDDLTRQSLLEIDPSFTSEEYSRVVDLLGAAEEKSYTCGKKFIFMYAETPLTYALNSGVEQVGQLVMLTFDPDSVDPNVLHLTCSGTPTKVFIVTVD